MIYVCIPSHDEAETVGLVLWKIRKVFDELGREYHVLVLDDGSSDPTREILDRYAKVLPLTILHRDQSLGYGQALELLLRRALDLSDRPRRDFAIVMHADYVHRPEQLPELVRRLDGGADVVVGQASPAAALPRSYRWARRFGAFWLRPAVRLRPVRDPLSGYLGLRLAVLRGMFPDGAPLLRGAGWEANAELLAVAAAQARSVETFPMDERHDLKARPSRVAPWSTMRSLVGARRRVAELGRQARSRAAERPRPDARPDPGPGRPPRSRRPRRRGRRS